MTVAAAAVLRTVEGAPVPLQEVVVRARLQDLLADVEVTQSYKNAEPTAIEAVYSFPLPVEAELLDVEVTVGERVLRGQVVERRQAERRYEVAIVDGDAAMMIERPEPGLYVMNVGNLLPGAEARIAFRYALLLRRQRDQYRFLHPTTIAPRYGRWALEPHQVPESSLLVDHACRIDVEVTGLLAGASIESPSHAIDIERADGRTVVRLRESRLLMDRDFVLNLRTAAAPPAVVLQGPDIDGGQVALALLQPDAAAAVEAPPRDLKIVIDCSGSMQGESIAQARVAVRRILDALRPQDRFAVVLFGSAHLAWRPDMQPGDDATVAAAQQALAGMIANMGGTEMGAALAAAYRIPVRAQATPTLILITDGEITERESVLSGARSSRHRLLTVGVGSAVAEGLLRELAAATGGACELVAPREDMAERIVRHFRRIDSGGARLTIDWPAPARDVVGLDDPVFAGDTVAVFARLERAAAGELRYALAFPDGRNAADRATIGSPESAQADDTLARLWAARRLFELGRAIDSAADADRGRLQQEAAALALRYRLLSPWTNWLLVVPQAGEATHELPALRKVSQMLAAGWGAAGMLGAPRMAMDMPTPCGSFDAMGAGTLSSDSAPSVRRSVFARFSDLAGGDGEVFGSLHSRISRGFAADLRSLLKKQATHRRGYPVLDDLAGIAGLPPAAIVALRRLVEGGASEQAVVAAFLRLLLEGPMDASFDRPTRRLILKLCRDARVPSTLADQVRQVIRQVPGTRHLLAGSAA